MLQGYLLTRYNTLDKSAKVSLISELRVGQSLRPGGVLIRRVRTRSKSVSLQATAHIPAQVAFELARRGLVHNSAAAVAKANVANLLLQYGALGALCASVATWIVFVTGQLYQSIQPQVDEVDEVWLHGVLVTNSKFLNQPLGRRAADFAANAHAGQTRLTGHPYVTHVIEAALIVESILETSCSSFALGERAEMAVVTALLHDVLDDTSVSEELMKEEFGAEITEMVKKVSRLSALNQLLRRKRREQHEAGTEALRAAEKEETATLQNMLVLMSDEPLVIVVKLADRLHNMRTTYALAPNKRRAVSLETLEVWCSLAERLGMFAIKSELEDLCFAVLDPSMYRELYLERNDLWQKELMSPAVQEEAIRASEGSQEHPRGPESISQDIASTSQDDSHIRIERGPHHVVKHDDRFVPKEDRKHISTHSQSSQGLFEDVAEGTRQMLGRGEQAFLAQQAKLQRQFTARRQQDQPPRHWLTHQKPKHRKERSYQLTREQHEVRDLLSTVLRFDDTTYKLGSTQFPDETADLAGLQACADRLIYEINVEAVATGLQVKIEGRLKSLNSVWKKMQRKKASLAEIYDARALRIIVDDGFGQQKQSAIEACYSLLTTVQQIWKKVSTEDDDDYIANPKPSGYQSLHTAVIGPGGAPLEVQIRTSSMHEVAEYGRAAHWTYKEHTPPNTSSTMPPGMLYRGQPVMKSQGGKLNLGVVLEWDEETRRCLVAINVNSRPNPGTPVSRERINMLIKEVEENGWCRPGDGNFSYYLEMFAFYKDNKFHNTDVYNARRGATLIPLSVEQEGSEPKDVPKMRPPAPASDPVAQAQQRMDEKIRLLREVLEWGESMKSVDAEAIDNEGPDSGANLKSSDRPKRLRRNRVASKEKADSFVVLVFPEGDFQVVPEGTTAADIIDQKELIMDDSSDCKVVNVNNLLVPEDTPLRKGDFIIRSRQLQDI